MASSKHDIAAILDELTVSSAKGEIKFLGCVVVMPQGSRRIVCGKADPLHLVGSFEFMKTKILLQEMREYQQALTD